MNTYLGTQRRAHLQGVLAHWDLPPITAIAAVQQSHRVFTITTRGPTFTLKAFSDTPDLPRLALTHDVLTHVARAGLRIPIPLRSRFAEFAVPSHGRFYRLAEWIEAGDYPRDPALQAELFYSTGRAMATLHHALAANPDAEVTRKTWHEDLAGRVAAWISALAAGLPAPQAAVVQRVGRERGVAITAALTGLPEQLIHRDCHPGNLLVRGTRVIGFIDWDDLCIGPRLFDVAYFAVHHLKSVTDDAAATQRWLTDLPQLLKGYRSLHWMSHAERAALPYAMLAYHLLLADWFMGLAQPESIAREVRALDWIDRHVDAIVAAIASS